MPEENWSDYGPTVLRVALGWMWLSHGLSTLLVSCVDGFAARLTAAGLPGALPWPVTVAEIGGAALLLLGWHGRWVSMALMPVLVGTLYRHVQNGWHFGSPGGGWEYPFFLLAASAAHMLLGDGALALGRRGGRLTSA